MSSIVLNKFRIENANVFYESFTNSNYYLSLGRPNSWVDDESPPTAFESTQQIAKIHRDIIFSLYINQANIAMVIPRINWTYSTIYDMYNDGYSSSNPSSTGATSLSDSKFYVINSSYNVYVCLGNNFGGVSTIEPTGTSIINIVPTDGYIWRYLYTIPTSEVQKFLSLDFMPVLENSTIASFAVPLSIETAIINYPGSGYATGTHTLVVHGDGSGASIDITVDSNGIIDFVNIPTANIGSNYSFASIDLTSIEDSSVTTVPAVIDLIISPSAGFGGDNKTLFNSVFVMMSVTISDDGSNSDIIINQEFRQISLLKDIKSSGGLTTALSLSALKVMNVSGFGTTNFIKDETIVGSNTGAEATVVTFDPLTGKLEYIQQSETGLGLDSLDDIKDFSTGDALSSSESGAAAGVDGFTASEQDLYSGSILYTENRPPIYRTTDQEENIKLVIEF